MTTIESKDAMIFRLTDDATGSMIIDGLFIGFIVLDEELKEEILTYKKDGFNIVGEVNLQNFIKQGKETIFKVTGFKNLKHKQKQEKK